MLAQRLSQIQARIRHACGRCGRDPASVQLVAVTKGVPPETLQSAISLGLKVFGENRIQEASAKRAQLAGAVGEVRWHLLGHLQRNKVREAVRLFDLIESVDRRELVDALERQAEASGRDPLDVLLQVNVSGEATKFGCAVDDVTALAQQVAQRPHLRLRGLMTIAPFSEDPEAARPVFRRLRELRDAIAAASSLEPRTLSLSMGMSQDFEVAIEEGADLVRIGTALFGARSA